VLHALIVLHRTYRSFPPAARLHILIRFLTCPFLRVVRLVGDAHTLLEIGGGHGLFSRLAADRGVRAFAVEPDLRKLHPVPRVRMIAGYDDCIRGTFDAIAIVDVLYAIPREEWDELLARCFSRLNPGGTLIVKEMDPSAKWKNRWNRMQEWLSVKLLKITLARTFNYETTAAFTARLERLGFEDVRVRRVDFLYPHPHVVYVATRG
jgi:SAM-dependent methyltransferase